VSIGFVSLITQPYRIDEESALSSHEAPTCTSFMLDWPLLQQIQFSESIEKHQFCQKIKLDLLVSEFHHTPIPGLLTIYSTVEEN